MLKARKVFGVLGGMGALASARFVETLYRRNLSTHEQAQPIVLLRSNPQLPDRTRALLDGRHEALAEALSAELEALRDSGADRMVMCCFTAHLVWDALPPELSARTVSLLDALYRSPGLGDRRRLVICTEATRQLGLLQGHPLYTPHQENLAFADGEAQATLHRLLYALKLGACSEEVMPALLTLAHDAGAEGFVAACTEGHLLDAPPEGLDLIDPLRQLADELPHLLQMSCE